MDAYESHAWVSRMVLAEPQTMVGQIVSAEQYRFLLKLR